jgi:hypothetical protein
VVSRTLETNISLTGRVSAVADGVHGVELWRTDGTAAGFITQPIKQAPVVQGAISITKGTDTVRFFNY